MNRIAIATVSARNTASTRHAGARARMNRIAIAGTWATALTIQADRASAPTQP